MDIFVFSIAALLSLLKTRLSGSHAQRMSPRLVRQLRPRLSSDGRKRVGVKIPEDIIAGREAGLSTPILSGPMAGEEEWLVRLTKRTLTMICDLSIALMKSNDLFDDPIVEEKTMKNC